MTHHTVLRPTRTALAPVLTLALGAGLLAACGTDDTPAPGAGGDAVTVTNCGQQVSYHQPLQRMFVNDGGMIAMSLSAGAHDQMTAVSSLARDKDVLRLKYGAKVDDLHEVNEKSPTLENVVAARPQLVYAGWNYGFSESKGLTPSALTDQGIEVYQLSEACRQVSGEKARGTMDPWVALDTDLRNIGQISGHPEAGAAAADDVARRLAALRAAPQPATPPTTFVFDSGSDTIFSSGRFGGPQGVISAAGGRNATEDVSDTWTKVSWERLTSANPDVIVFVDYPGQSADEKIASLRSNPASRDLKAVKEGHFVNLPYAMWVSSPLNIDAAETMRAVFEAHGLAPRSGITPALPVASLGLAGNDWLPRP